MRKTISWQQYLEAKGQGPSLLLDVRSPGEFAEGRVPGARNLPLFDNEERARVGTIYKQQGREAAVRLGLGLIGPRLASMVARVDAMSKDKSVGVHCWRGGMRSDSMAWLLEMAGYEPWILQGGYKAYRNLVLSEFAKPRSFRVLGGRTGSGKTEILLEMKALGAQVIDLEGLANHKGSAFGALLQPDQPSQQNFEHALFNELRRLDPARPIWIEDESVSIGRVSIPQGMWQQKQNAPVVVVEMGGERRVARLVEEYAGARDEELAESLGKIRKRLGGQHLNAAMAALAEKDYATVARIALTYYDKAYDRGLANKQNHTLGLVEGKTKRIGEIAREILALAEKC